MERPKLVNLRGGILLSDFPVRFAKNPGVSIESFTTNPLGPLDDHDGPDSRAFLRHYFGFSLAGWVENSPLFWTPLFLIGIALYRFSDRWSTVLPSVASIATITSLSLLLLLCGLLHQILGKC